MKRHFFLPFPVPLLAAIFIVLAVSCNKTDKNLATVTTSEITGITDTSARGGGEVTADGGFSVTERGICWSTAHNPTTADSKTSDGEGTGVFFSSLTGLSTHAVYFVRAYATNSAGTAYGSEIGFIAVLADTANIYFTDGRDGHKYRMVRIGIQTWMAENLAYLPAVAGPQTGSDTLPFFYVYGYDSTIVDSAKQYRFRYKDPLISDSFKVFTYKTYGVLYNWPAAGVSCPPGWHLPSEADWNLLIETVGSPVGGKLKEIGRKHADADTTHWLTPNTGATDSSGFTAIPGGERYSLGNDSTIREKFRYINRNAVFWSSTVRDGTNTWARHLYFDNNRFDRDWFSNSNGFSVRCLKN